MSNKGIYTALSGAIAQTQRLDTIANNIANVNTPGFKKDQQVFQEYLTSFEKPQDVMNVPRVPASIESFYDMQGGDKSFVDTKGTFTDFSQGSLKPTGNPLDVAIDGKGLFEVSTPGGVRMTRAGNFTLDGMGQLVTKEGFPVLKSGEGGDLASRVIKATGTGPIHIEDNGEVFQGTESLGTLSVVRAGNEDALRKIGNNLYDVKSNMNPDLQPLKTPSLKQGFIELSNVNIVQEMTDMITASRTFESTQRAIHAYDQMSDKIVNVVGKVTP